MSNEQEALVVSDREALAKTLSGIPGKRETETFGQYDRRRAGALLASGVVTTGAEYVAGLAGDEALAVILAESIWEDEPSAAELDLIRQALRNLPAALSEREASS